MSGKLWEKIGKLEEGALLARAAEAPWVRVIGDEAELLDDDMFPTGRRRKTDELKFKTPVDPVKIWCIGLNYGEHAKESNMEVPDEPCVFMKPTTCLIPHGETIKIPNPAGLGRVDYEGELAVVIGKNCRNVGPENALEYVLGYSCFNDVSARVLQKKDGQWIRSKGFDTFGPFGPVLLLKKAISPKTVMTTRLNGAVVQKTTFADMIFSAPQIISHISRFATLEAGDVIATGTPSGVGSIKPGDVVEVDIEGIGTLRNPVTAEAANG